MSITKEINQNLENIRSLLLRNTRTKNQVFQRTFLLKRRRTEDLKRKSQETALEAPNLVRNAVGRSFITQSMARTGKSFLERIMGFLGYLTAGWIFNNLPTWIALGKEFIARIKKGREIVSNFIDSVKGTFSGIGKVLNAALTNLKELDFLDSKKRLEKEWNNMSTQMNNIGKSIDEGYKLITTPLFDDERKGTYSEEQIPELGTQVKEEEPKQQTTPTPTPTPQPTPPRQPTPPAQPSTSTGHYPGKNQTREMRALLNVIAYAEGTDISVKMPNNGYNTHFAGSQTADLSAHPNIVKRSSGYASAAFGRYQFMPKTWIRIGGACKSGGNIPYTPGMSMSPANQDEIAVKLINMRGVTQAMLQKEGFSVNVSAKLSPEWASLPNARGQSHHNQPVRKYETLKQLYDKELGKPTSSQQPRQTPVQPQTPRVSQGQSKFESDILEFREFRKTQFGASSKRFPTFDPRLYQMREFGVFGSGNYKINPLADDTNYEIHEHKGAGHWENRAMDIPVPHAPSKQGDMVAEFWRKKGYKVLWNNGDKVHDNHVHVEVPPHKTAEFFTLTRQMPSLSQERRGPKVVVVEQTGTTNTSSSSKQTNIINDLSSYVSNISKSMLTKLGFQ